MSTVEDVERVMAALLTNGKVQRATHNIMAYRIAVPAKGTHLQVEFCTVHRLTLADLRQNLHQWLCMQVVRTRSLVGVMLKQGSY